MSYPQKFDVTVATIADGTGTGFIEAVRGRIANIIYTKVDFDDGVVFTITTEDSGQGVWAETAVDDSTSRAPVQASHDTVGVASVYVAAGTAVNVPIYVANERIKIVIASGGNVKTGTFTVIVV